MLVILFIINQLEIKPSKSKTRVTTPYRRLPEEEWRRVYNAHQPLYSKEEFDRIKQYFECNVKSQRIRSENIC